MELDDLKQAWLTIDRRLDQQDTLMQGLYRDGKLDTLRRRLRPLVRGQAQRERHTVPLDETLHDTADEGSADFEADDSVRALQRVVAALDPLNRALLVLYLEDRSVREIGEILGLSETNVTTKISRLKQRIRNDLR